MEKEKNKLLQWNPAFYAGIQIEFEKERDRLIFENEHTLSKKPMLIDVLIIKKNTKEVLKKNIMILGSKGHAIHACMKMHDFGTRKNMRKQPFFEEK